MSKRLQEFDETFCYYPTLAHKQNDIPKFRPEVTVYEVWDWIAEKLKEQYEKGWNDANIAKYVEKKMEQGGKL